MTHEHEKNRRERDKATTREVSVTITKGERDATFVPWVRFIESPDAVVPDDESAAKPAPPR